MTAPHRPDDRRAPAATALDTHPAPVRGRFLPRSCPVPPRARPGATGTVHRHRFPTPHPVLPFDHHGRTAVGTRHDDPALRPETFAGTTYADGHTGHAAADRRQAARPGHAPSQTTLEAG